MKHLALSVALAWSAACVPALAAEPNASAAEIAKAREELRAAREELAAAAAKLAQLSNQLGKEHRKALAHADVEVIRADAKARIGVLLGGSTKGTQVNAVSPGSPAEKAGIRNGDVLVSVNGEKLPESPLKSALGNDFEWVDGSDPGVKRARELLADLKDGQSVQLGLMRDGKPLNATVKAERRDSWRWPELAGLGGLGGLGAMDRLRELDRNVFVFEGHPEINTKVIVKEFEPLLKMHKGADLSHLENALKHARTKIMMLGDEDWRQLELSSLNPQLGRYFGTTSGVLVLERGGKGFSELQPGDVLIAIDDQPVNDVREAVRRLSDKPAGSVAKVQLMRDRKVIHLQVIVPEHGAMFAPPAPPVPPTPPTPPTPRAKGRIAPPAPPAPPTPPAAPAPPAPPAMALLDETIELI